MRSCREHGRTTTDENDSRPERTVDGQRDRLTIDDRQGRSESTNSRNVARSYWPGAVAAVGPTGA